jgi:hypothetical protein
MTFPKNNIEIANWIRENTSFVINSINRNDVDKYLLIQTEYNKKIPNNQLFKTTFKNLYGLNVAALGDDFEEKFFGIFDKLAHDDNENFNIKEILSELYNVKTKKAKTVQFSFLTKMMHTINDGKVIYDSKVRFLFNLPELYTISNFDIKVDKYLNQYELIEHKYEEILKEKLIDETLAAFDRRFNKITISKMKKLDFIYWTTGKFFYSEHEYFKSTKRTTKSM